MNSTNLSPYQTPFIGRQTELLSLTSHFEQSRLLTLLGPPGIGKTRLAKEYALSLVDDFANEEKGGVWFLDLTEANTEEDLCMVLGRTLHIPFSQSHSLSNMVKQLGQALSDIGPSLLIFDNFEQLIFCATPILEQWLQLCANTLFLVTSRERLQIAPERLFSLSPLSLPEHEKDPIEAEAVQLFLERVTAIRGKYEPNNAELLNIGKLVQKLDGLPLAIEIAAARMRVFNCAQLLEHLTNRLDFLKTKYSSEKKRYHTLREAIDWSWSLLLPYEQDLLSSCTVFESGFSLDAAKAILDLSSFPDAPDISEVLESLLDKSLLHSYVPKEFPDLRFGMYESIKEFLKEKWKEHPEKHAIEQRHRNYYLRMGALWSENVYHPDGSSYFAHLALEQDNFLYIFRRDRNTYPAECVKAILILAPLFLTQGPSHVYLDWLTQAISFLDNTHKQLWATLLLTRAKVYQMQGLFTEAESDLTTGLSFAKQENLLYEEGLLLHKLGHLRAAQGRYEEMLPGYQRALTLFRQTGKQTDEAFLLRDIAGIYREKGGDQETSLATYQEALQLARQVKNLRCEQLVMEGCAVIYYEQGLYQKSLDSFQYALKIAQKTGDLLSESYLLSHCAIFYFEQELFKEALSYFQKALELARQIGDQRAQRVALFGIVATYREQGVFQKAWHTLEIAFSLPTQSGDPNQSNHLLAEQGRLYQEEENFEKTLSCYEQIKRNASGGQPPPDKIMHLTNSAYLFFEQENYQDALSHYQEAITLAQKIGETRYEGILAYEIGRVFHFQHQIENASSQYQYALKNFQKAPTRKYEGLSHAYLGALLAQSGKIQEAKIHFSTAKDKLDTLQNPFLQEALNLLTGHLSLGLAKQTLETKDFSLTTQYQTQATQLLQIIEHKKTKEGALMLACSSELRLAKRLLQQTLSRFETTLQKGLVQKEKDHAAAKSKTLSSLRIGKDLWSFQAPGQNTPIRLETRTRPRLVLKALLNHRETKPGKPLSTKALFNAGWPNESAHPESARNRVYAIIKILRNFGLRDVLLQKDDGYLLDATVSIIREDF